jgi:hypothetical protein
MSGREWGRNGSFSVASKPVFLQDLTGPHSRDTAYLQLLTPSQAIHVFSIFARAMESVQRTVAISRTHLDGIFGFCHDGKNETAYVTGTVWRQEEMPRKDEDDRETRDCTKTRSQCTSGASLKLKGCPTREGSSTVACRWPRYLAEKTCTQVVK